MANTAARKILAKWETGDISADDAIRQLVRLADKLSSDYASLTDAAEDLEVKTRRLKRGL